MSFSVMLQQLAGGLGQTMIIFALTLVLALPMGLVVMLGRRSRFKPLSWLVRAYISIIRGTPLILQLLVVCFGPYYISKWLVDLGLTQQILRVSGGWRFTSLILGFVINYAAYFCEIYRSGMDSIPVGQLEAAEILGYNRAQTFIRIELPQMVKRVLPSVTNEIITLVKDTSLAYALAYTEMFTLAKQIAAAETSIMPLFVAGLFYFVVNALVAWGMALVEKAFGYYTI